MNLYRLLLLLLLPLISAGQIVHSHNDYLKPEPLMGAYKARAGSIEADVFLVDGKLLVAHTKGEIQSGRTLDSLYLKPIVQLFEQNKGRWAGKTVSPDRRYSFQLMVDVKSEAVPTLKQLLEAVAPYREYFDRSLNPMAVQLVISGNRPTIDTWIDYPPFIQFDGRPNEVYDNETLKRVALFSDTYRNYSRWNGEGELPDQDRETLKRVIKRTRNYDKPIRFWAIPDTPTAWKQLAKLGVDYINTDKAAECAAVVK